MNRIKSTIKRRDFWQILTAIITLFLGHGLIYADFILSACNLHSPSLYYFGMCLGYAGSGLGIALYINSKFNQIEQKIGSHEVDK